MKHKLLVALSAVLIGAVSSVQAVTGTIYSDLNDGFTEDIGGVVTVHPSSTDGTGWQGAVGEWYGNVATLVLPFELPNLGANADPFTSVDLGLLVNDNTTTPAPATDIDLYAVRVDASPVISASDSYWGTAIDPGATLIQESFLNPTTPRGWDGAPNNFTDAGGDAALLSYMNTAYDSGAGAGQFVFLRLSYATDTAPTGWDTYNINLSEADSTDFGGGPLNEDPRITYEAIPEPATLGLLGLSGLALWFVRRRI